MAAAVSTLLTLLYFLWRAGLLGERLCCNFGQRRLVA